MIPWRPFVRRMLERVANVCLALSRRVYMPLMEREAQRWTRLDGDHTLRLDYDLDSESVVFDLGGYQGQWASDLFACHGSRIHVFEPVPEYAQRIRRRFTSNARITVHECGLASINAQVDFYMQDDGTSQFRPNKGASVSGTLREAAGYMEEMGITRIDLMKINIEGGEYDLLEHLIASHWIGRIRDLQVQFHDCVPDAHAKLKHAHNLLAVTHRLTYHFPFVWENWRLRSTPD